MDWKFCLLFGCMWFVGIFIYSTFGTQIAIMNRCGKQLYYALYDERNSWDDKACQKYMRKVKIVDWSIIAIATGLIYRLAGPGFWGYVCGVFFTWLLSIRATGCNATNVGEACKLFLRFAKFGKEEYIKCRMEEILQHPEALALVQRPAKRSEKRTDNYLLPLLLAFTIAALAFAIGLEVGKTKVDPAWDEGYDSGYAAGYDKGKEAQLATDKYNMMINGQSLQSIIKDVSTEYGIEPADAYRIYTAYNEEPGHGGYSWDEYQKAIRELIFFASLIPYS